MPIDVTLPLCLSKEDFLYPAPPPTCQPALRFHLPHVSNHGELPDERSERGDHKKAKKQVTFADHRGLALTRVKVFSEFDDPISIPANIQEMLRSALSLSAAAEDKLELDFSQPSSDYLAFRHSLETKLVSLERCVLKERSFAGTVKVKNISYHKRVTLRVTFDHWKSHLDMECIYVRDSYPSAYSDTFSFEVALPSDPPPQHVEFAICYALEGKEHWDSNHGNNYCILRSSARKSRTPVACGRGSHFGIHFDRYGSPTCSHGVFADWPSYANYENIGPYY